ncbi:MAG: eCIS core domain-containing protein [Fimbriimonas sp.]
MAERASVEARAERVAVPSRERDLEAQADRAAAGQTRIGGSAPSSSGPLPSGVPDSVRNVLAQSGRPLESSVQGQMENRLWADLRHVRVHQDGPSTADLRAKAFAWGRDVVVRPDLWAPSTSAGADLLAHELAHTLQQAPLLLCKGDPAAGVSFQFRVAISSALDSNALVAEFKRQYSSTLLSEAERTRVKNETWSWTGEPVSATRQDAARGYILLTVTDRGIRPVSDEERKKHEESLKGLSLADRQKINEETTKRLAKASNSAPTSTNSTYEDAIRGKLIEERVAIDKLPRKVKEILFSPDATRILDPSEYAQALRIGEKLAAMDPAQLREWESRVSGRTDDLSVFEASLDAYLRREAETEAERQVQQQRQTDLLSLASLYALYRSMKSNEHLGSMPSVDQDGIADDTVGDAKITGMTQREQLLTGLKARGIYSIAAFEAQIEAWKRGFEGVSQKLGNQILDKLDHQLFLAENQYARSDAAATIFAAIKTSGAPGSFARADDARRRAIWRPNHVLDEGGGTNDDEAIEAATESAAADQRGMAAMGTLKGAFPLLSLPEFPIGSLARAADAGQVSSVIAGYLADRRKAVEDARTELNADPSLVYKFDRLRAAAFQDQGIGSGSMLETIVNDHISDQSIKQIIKGVLVAVLAIALTIVSFGTGTAAVLAAGGAFTLSAASAWEAYRDYIKDSNAQDAGLLTDEPSVIWVVLAVAGAALDAAALARAVAAVRALKPAILAFNESGDILKFTKAVKAANLSAATEKAVLDAAVLQASRAADIAGAAKVAAQGKVGWIQRMGAAGEAASELVLKSEGATVKNLNDFTPNAGNFPTLDLTTDKGFASVKVKGTHTVSLSEGSLTSYVSDFSKVADKEKLTSVAAEVGANRKAIQDAGAWPARLPLDASVDDIATFMSKNAELWIPDDHVAKVVAELKQKALANPARFGLNPDAPDLATQVDALAARVRSMGIKSNEIDDIVTPLVKAGPESLPATPKPPAPVKAKPKPTPTTPTSATAPKPVKAPKPPKPPAPAPYSATNKLNLNSATIDDLKRLPGVGDALAEKILKARTDAGGFEAINDLLEVEGIGQKTIDKFKSVVVF